jgi:hypothetical protein
MNGEPSMQIIGESFQRRVKINASKMINRCHRISREIKVVQSLKPSVKEKLKQ